MDAMSLPTEFSTSQFARFVGTPDAPVVIDVRTDDDFNEDPRMLPASQRRNHQTVAEWASAFAGKRVLVSCQKGLKLSQGTAAWLRHFGANASSLEGGFESWRNAGGPL